MQEPAQPPDEEARLEALQAYDILDTLPEERFDDLAELAATLCEVPMSLITFVDEDRQWNKACVGVKRDAVDREVSFCGHVVAEHEPVVVEDTTQDERFRDNPLVTGDPGYRFYAGVPITDPDGYALGTVCVLDTAARSLSEDRLAGLETIAAQVIKLLQARVESLQQARESGFLRGVVDSLNEHVAILDESGTIVATNQAWDEFAGSQGGAAGPGSDYLEAARPGPGEASSQAYEGLKAVIEGDRDTFELEYPCHGPDEQRWFRMTVTGFQDRGRRFVVSAHRNVTEAKLAEQDLRELNTELAERDQMIERLGETLPQVLWLVEPDLDHVPFLGARASEFWGIDREVLEENPLAWVDRLVADDQERFGPWLEETLEGFESGDRDSAAFSFRFQRPGDDSTRHGRIEAFPIRQEGELQMIAGITEDRTETHREAERERRQARQQARLTELQQLVFATSHTLKTEVRRIRSYGQLLQSRLDTKAGDIGEPVEEMLAGSRRLEELHEALREYAEVTQDRVTPEPVDLEELVREVVAERAPDIEGAGGSARIGELPTVHVDPEQVRRLFAELVDNAVKFAGDDPPAIEVSGKVADEGAEVRFADEGVGFDPQYADKVFEIFQQLEPAETEGVGIGLTTVQRIVENHGGEITVETAPGEGTAFVFTLREEREA